MKNKDIFILHNYYQWAWAPRNGRKKVHLHTPRLKKRIKHKIVR
jgi:hypothetical protein